jgi:hypothetical protein
LQAIEGFRKHVSKEKMNSESIERSQNKVEILADERELCENRLEVAQKENGEKESVQLEKALFDDALRVNRGAGN